MCVYVGVYVGLCGFVWVCMGVGLTTFLDVVRLLCGCVRVGQEATSTTTSSAVLVVDE